MNRSADQTNRPRTASRFTRFVCPMLRFIPHEPRKKDTHSLNTQKITEQIHKNKYYRHSFTKHTYTYEQKFILDSLS